MAGRGDQPSAKAELFREVVQHAIDGFGSGMGDEMKESAPMFLNATNGKQKEGASFEYTKELGSEGVLAPSGISGAMVWRLKLVNQRRVPDLHFAVEGLVPAHE